MNETQELLLQISELRTEVELLRSSVTELSNVNMNLIEVLKSKKV